MRTDRRARVDSEAMAGSPDLFVVCKNCRSEVSPYITECPYCGHRLRKRAPKLDKGGVPRPQERRRRRPQAPRLGRLRAGEIPGVRGDTRPYATFALVLVPMLVTLVGDLGLDQVGDLVLFGGLDGDPWKLVTTTLVYGSTTYEFIALAAIFLFGWLLERRHGWWAPLLVFLAGSVAGMGLAVLGDPAAIAWGGNAGALALLGAWVVRDGLAARGGQEIEADMLGVAAIAIVLALLPAAYPEADPLAGAGGAVAGLLLGVPLARLRER